ncbi:uncharacterized protein Triagg1_4464 [Trichoderma aggressivum f. europaeum]|uniref:Uncharacterized protein n=1 Tax=Trichoderma aggressivum f. europaeum TaxID=173218 RepID=A0AAE1IDT0_9HYPO|nr:hypothetical protein Triagg1_4464 [Trichoderma aggressivum f. europaeum]
MASTTEDGNPAHKMKRTGRALWKRNTFGGTSSSPMGDRVKSQTGQGDDVPLPMVVSDILPSAASYQSAPPIETPVPLPVPMRAPTSTTTAAPGLAMKQNTMAANKNIVQAQRDWEKKQTQVEDQGPTQERRPQTYVDLPKASTRLESTEISGTSPQRQLTSETDAMAGLKRLPEEALLQQMTELNRPASVNPKRRESRPNTASSAASASTYASASASASPLPSDPGDAMDTGDGETLRTGLQTNADNASYYAYIGNYTMLHTALVFDTELTWLLPEDDGTEQSTNNAPIPPGKERYDDGENGEKLAFICPVRDCRVLHQNMRAMTSHFHGKHNRSLFNDNGDGTFSKVGDYVNEDGSSPGIVVSRNPLSPGAPPPAVPDYTENRKKQLQLLSKRSLSTSRVGVVGSAPPDTSKRSLRGDASTETMEERLAKRPKTTPVPLPVQANSFVSPPPIVRPIPSPPSITPTPIQSLGLPMTDVLRYLHRSLSPTQQVPARLDVLALSKYRQVRNLPGLWWEHHHNKTLDPLQYACALAYLVGRAEEMNPCDRWKGLSRLSSPCVGLPADLPAEARAVFSKSVTCIACQYQFCCYRTKNECEWAHQDQDLGGKTEEAIPQKNYQAAVEEGDKAAALDDEDTTMRWSNGLSSSARQPEEYPVQDSEKKNPPLGTTALHKPSPAELTEMEEMEDWEIAPGTMKDETTNTNIGFSNAYMSNQHPITISPGLSFNVLILKPGHTHHWPIEATKVRTCSVASGKISVKMGNDQAFKLGPNGVVVIRPGQSCMVVNRLYSDAILHCTTLDDL